MNRGLLNVWVTVSHQIEETQVGQPLAEPHDQNLHANSARTCSVLPLRIAIGF